jgi:hypothetical protein
MHLESMVLLQEGMMIRMGMLGHVFVTVIGLVLGTIGWCGADEPWQVREFKLDWPKPPAGPSDSHSTMKPKDEDHNEVIRWQEIVRYDDGQMPLPAVLLG